MCADDHYLLPTKKEKIPIESKQNDCAFVYYPKTWALRKGAFL